MTPDSIVFLAVGTAVMIFLTVGAALTDPKGGPR